MDDQPVEKHQSMAVKQIRRHQFTSLLVGSIIIACFLVFVALSLYESSGTIQLDLSRPGYAQARKNSQKESTIYKGFSADGPINQTSLDAFDTLYKEKAKEASSINAFSGDALSDETLQLN